jgi:hypothetical protein
MPVLHLLLLPGLVGRESGGERSGSAEFAVPVMGVGVGSVHLELEGKSERDNTGDACDGGWGWGWISCKAWPFGSSGSGLLVRFIDEIWSSK